MNTFERDRILAKMVEQFMQPEIIEGRWAEIERKHGDSATVPYEYYNVSDLEDGDTVLVREGFGARLSAPGYMDCTDWAVFKTEDEAKAYLVETYGDDIEDDEGDTLYWSGSLSCFSPALEVPREAAEDCSAAGAVDDAVAFWVERCKNWPSDSVLRAELKECGAWDDLDTVDTDCLRQRTLFVIAEQLLENEKENAS